MPTIHVTPFPQEASWQEFEKITRDALALKWESPTLALEGRHGQNQFGVDIFGPDYLGRPVAIQCKKCVRKLSLKTIEKEIEKADVLVKQNRTLFVETFQSELATHHR